MGWNKTENVSPPVGRPLLVRTTEDGEATTAFLALDGVWYAGAALVQNSANILDAVPAEWCEPTGDARL